jgi:catechol 2,3-dioxygenase-like lactoylglutathione lyase family enzyme
MAIILNHTVVPAHDKEVSARFFADIFGLKYEGSTGHFAPLRGSLSIFDFPNDYRSQFIMNREKP